MVYDAIYIKFKRILIKTTHPGTSRMMSLSGWRSCLEGASGACKVLLLGGWLATKDCWKDLQAVH